MPDCGTILKAFSCSLNDAPSLPLLDRRTQIDRRCYMSSPIRQACGSFFFPHSISNLSRVLSGDDKKDVRVLLRSILILVIFGRFLRGYLLFWLSLIFLVISARFWLWLSLLIFCVVICYLGWFWLSLLDFGSLQSSSCLSAICYLGNHYMWFWFSLFDWNVPESTMFYHW